MTWRETRCGQPNDLRSYGLVVLLVCVIVLFTRAKGGQVLLEENAIGSEVFGVKDVLIRDLSVDLEDSVPRPQGVNRLFCYRSHRFGRVDGRTHPGMQDRHACGSGRTGINWRKLFGFQICSSKEHTSNLQGGASPGICDNKTKPSWATLFDVIGFRSLKVLGWGCLHWSHPCPLIVPVCHQSHSVGLFRSVGRILHGPALDLHFGQRFRERLISSLERIPCHSDSRRSCVGCLFRFIPLKSGNRSIDAEDYEAEQLNAKSSPLMPALGLRASFLRWLVMGVGWRRLRCCRSGKDLTIGVVGLLFGWIVWSVGFGVFLTHRSAFLLGGRL